MTDNELLLQISDLLDVKLQSTENRLREEIRQVESRLETRLQRIESKIENDITPCLQNIESCYTSTYDRYRIDIERIDALGKDIMLLN